MKRIRCVEFFPGFRRVHTYKDPGMVLQEMCRQGVDGTLCMLQNEELDENFRPRVIAVPHPFALRMCSWLWKNAKKTDVLFLFHTHPLNPLYAAVLRIRNARAVVYVKADMDNTILTLNSFTPKNVIRRVKIWWNLYVADVVSIEQQGIFDLIKKRYPPFANKLHLMPNGYGGGPDVKRKSFQQKENIILCVGFVGSEQKATDTILEVLTKLDMKHWRVIFAGAVVEGFQEEIDEFFVRNPGLKEHVTFLGHISDRKEMLSLYNKAKIFFMPSRYEGFPISPLEAAYFGNVIVGTPVGGIAELTRDGGATCPIGDVAGLAKELQKRMNNQKLLKKEGNATRKLCEKAFMWKPLVKNLLQRLQKAINQRATQSS